MIYYKEFAKSTFAEGIMETEFFVGWGTLSLINAGLAQVKNQLAGNKDLGGLAWWIISLFLGPVATFLIVVFKDYEPSSRPEPEKPNES